MMRYKSNINTNYIAILFFTCNTFTKIYHNISFRVSDNMVIEKRKPSLHSNWMFLKCVIVVAYIVLVTVWLPTAMFGLLSDNYLMTVNYCMSDHKYWFILCMYKIIEYYVVGNISQNINTNYLRIINQYLSFIPECSWC